MRRNRSSPRSATNHGLAQRPGGLKDKGKLPKHLFGLTTERVGAVGPCPGSLRRTAALGKSSDSLASSLVSHNNFSFGLLSLSGSRGDRSKCRATSIWNVGRKRNS